jgi:DNA-binding transcriptional ArsR family regulator
MSLRSGGDVDIEDAVLEFCWGVWAELGVSGWARSHQGWAIDVEPFIIFTAAIGGRDPRLRDESTDWCIRNWRLVSRVRLRNILRDQSAEVLDSWGPFAATVNARAGTDWPEATTERNYQVTGRSGLRPLTDPSMTYLRIRAIFGLGARAEILRYLLYNIDFDRISAQMLAEGTNYGKRQVSEAAEWLAQAGVLRQRMHANRNIFSLADRASLKRFVGAQPDFAPEWNNLLLIVETVLGLSDAFEKSPTDVLRVETRRALRRVEPALDELGIAGPRSRSGVEAVGEWRRWASELMSDLAAGEWPGAEVSQT